MTALIDQKEILEFLRDTVALCERVDSGTYLIEKENRQLAILNHLIKVYNRASSVEPQNLADIFGSVIGSSTPEVSKSISHISTWRKPATDILDVSDVSDTESDFSDPGTVASKSEHGKKQRQIIKLLDGGMPGIIEQIAREAWVDVRSDSSDDESDEEDDDEDDSSIKSIQSSTSVHDKDVLCEDVVTPKEEMKRVLILPKSQSSINISSC